MRLLLGSMSSQTSSTKSRREIAAARYTKLLKARWLKQCAPNALTNSSEQQTQIHPDNEECISASPSRLTRNAQRSEEPPAGRRRGRGKRIEKQTNKTTGKLIDSLESNEANDNKVVASNVWRRNGTPVHLIASLSPVFLHSHSRQLRNLTATLDVWIVRAHMRCRESDRKMRRMHWPFGISRQPVDGRRQSVLKLKTKYRVFCAIFLVMGDSKIFGV